MTIWAPLHVDDELAKRVDAYRDRMAIPRTEAIRLLLRIGLAASGHVELTDNGFRWSEPPWEEENADASDS
jgi:hypothetical protein